MSYTFHSEDLSQFIIKYLFRLASASPVRLSFWEPVTGLVCCTCLGQCLGILLLMNDTDFPALFVLFLRLCINFLFCDKSPSV